MKTIYTIFPWLPGAPSPTHVDYAKRQLEEAKVMVLEAQQSLERNQANVQTLKARVARLDAYVREHAEKQQ